MELFLQILMFAYIVAIFFITNHFSKKFVQANMKKKWLRRRIIVPLGCIILTISLFILAAFAPTEVLIIIIVPQISFFVGLVAHMSFAKVSQYEVEAAANSPYLKKNKK